MVTTEPKTHRRLTLCVIDGPETAKPQHRKPLTLAEVLLGDTERMPEREWFHWWPRFRDANLATSTAVTA